MPLTSETGNLDLREVVRVLGRRKWLVIGPWLVALAVGVGAAFLLPPIYFSTAKLVLERPAALSGALGELVGGTAGPDPDRQAEAMRDQIQSTAFLRQVVAASGLASDPEVRVKAMRGSKLAAGADEAQRVEAWLIEQLRKEITVRRGRGDVIEITVGDGHPGRAQRLAEAVSLQFVEATRQAQLEVVRATQAFSAEQLKVYEKRLRESEAQLEAAMRSGGGGGAVSGGNADRARGLQSQASVEVDDQRAKVASLRAQLSGRVRDNDLRALSSGRASQLTAQLTQLERQLAQSRLGGGDDDGASVRLMITRKYGELEQELTQRAAMALPSASPDIRETMVRLRLAQADLAAKEAGSSYLGGQLGGYQARASVAPSRNLQVERLKEQVDADRALYNSFVQQSTAAQINEALQKARVTGRFEVLEPAMLPLTPGKPNRPVLILLAFVLGGLIGVGTVLVIEQHDQSMKNAEEVESLLGLPVLGAVPRVEELDRGRRRGRNGGGGSAAAAPDPGLIHRLKVESPLGLEFRRIYLKLAKTRGRSLPKTLLVTSATRGEGKTTTAACLGITLARELREKVLLVDFDLRSPQLHRALGLPGSSWGLAQMLQQRHFDERFVRATAVPGLDFLAAGRSERPAGELVDTAAADWFVQEAASRYALVVIDAPPNLAVPDPLLLGRSVEGVLYVIKAGTTVRKAAEYGVKVQREARDNVLGVLMNDAGEILPQYYGYRHYSYGYSSGTAGSES